MFQCRHEVSTDEKAFRALLQDYKEMPVRAVLIGSRAMGVYTDEGARSTRSDYDLILTPSAYLKWKFPNNAAFTVTTLHYNPAHQPSMLKTLNKFPPPKTTTNTASSRAALVIGSSNAAEQTKQASAAHAKVSAQQASATDAKVSAQQASATDAKVSAQQASATDAKVAQQASAAHAKVSAQQASATDAKVVQQASATDAKVAQLASAKVAQQASAADAKVSVEQASAEVSVEQASAEVSVEQASASAKLASSDVLVCKCGVTFADGTRLEFEIPLTSGSSASRLLSEMGKFDYRVFCWPLGCDVAVAPPALLECIKRSHIYWPVQFQKTVTDLHILRTYLQCFPHFAAPVESYQRFLCERLGETEQRNGVPGAHINLNQSNGDFLDREGILTVRKIIPHDDIHELVKFGSQPMYTRIKKDMNKAACDQKMFEALSLQERIQDVQEEGMVLALERYLLLGRLNDAQEAYRRALERICTTITKGWFREFAIDYYPQIYSLPIDKDLNELKANILKSHDEKKRNEYKGNGADSWLEWFSAEELQKLAPVRKSWRPIYKTRKTSSSASSHSWGRNHDSRIIGENGTFEWNKTKYELKITAEDWNGGGDCTHCYEYKYRFEIQRYDDSNQLEAVALWAFETESSTGSYDSNRGQTSHTFAGTSDLDNGFDNGFPHAEVAGFSVTMLAELMGQRWNAKEIFQLIFSYWVSDLAPLWDNHFLVRFWLANLLLEEKTRYHQPSDVCDAIEEWIEKSHIDTLERQRRALQLVDGQRSDDFYHLFLSEAPTFLLPFQEIVD